jgi:hypothetical protein
VFFIRCGTSVEGRPHLPAKLANAEKDAAIVKSNNVTAETDHLVAHKKCKLEKRAEEAERELMWSDSSPLSLQQGIEWIRLKRGVPPYEKPDEGKRVCKHGCG